MNPRRVLITGALGRIGHCVAETFLRNGDSVTTVDARRVARTEQKLAAAAEGSNAVWNSVIADLLPLAQLGEKYGGWSSEFGPFDVLINNAGCNAFGNARDLPLEQWQRVFDVNLTVPFVLSACFARELPIADALSARCIVNVASTSGFVAEQNTAAYNCSKAGLVMLTKSAAIDLAPMGIRVNGVAPGFIQVPDDDPLFGKEPSAVVQAYIEHTPLRRGVTLEEIAGAIRFLCSGEASGITGEIVRVDGGQLAMAVPPLNLGQEMDDLRHERKSVKQS